MSQLIAADLPEQLVHDADEPDPWLDAVRRLEGLRLLTSREDRRLARAHRIVQAIVRDGLDMESRERTVARIAVHAIARAVWLVTNWGRKDCGWEISPVVELAGRLLAEEQRDGGVLALFIASPLEGQGRFVESSRLLTDSTALFEKRARALPDDVGAQRNWSLSLNRMGDLSLRAGLPDEARTYFQQGLDIAERLARALPDDYQAQRDRSVFCGKMAFLAQAEKDQGQSAHWFGQALATLRGMKQHFGRRR